MQRANIDIAMRHTKQEYQIVKLGFACSASISVERTLPLKLGADKGRHDTPGRTDEFPSTSHR